MAGFDVSYGERGQSLHVWFDHPKKAHHSETKGENLILKKDDHGHVIGIEHRNYFRDAMPAFSEEL